MNNTITPEEVKQAQEEIRKIYVELYELLKDDPDAQVFVVKYGEYVEMIDDIVDEPKNVELVLKAFNHAMLLFSTPFWIKYHQQLMMVDTLINNEYGDSVIWESSNCSWKSEDAKVMSHCGYNMMFAVIALVAGRDKLREVSCKFRQWAHIKHRSHHLGV